MAQGDLRDSHSIRGAMAGVGTVICAVQAGFGVTGGSTPQSVDLKGTQDLIAAAQAESVDHFILLSIIDVAPNHPLDLWRMRYRAEQALKRADCASTRAEYPAIPLTTMDDAIMARLVARQPTIP